MILDHSITLVRESIDACFDQPAKAAREVRIGDALRITNNGEDFQVEVLLLSEVRGPAPVAQKLYRETEQSRELRLKIAAERKAMKEFEDLSVSRPSERDRRNSLIFRLLAGRENSYPRMRKEAGIANVDFMPHRIDSQGMSPVVRSYVVHHTVLVGIVLLNDPGKTSIET